MDTKRQVGGGDSIRVTPFIIDWMFILEVSKVTGEDGGARDHQGE